MLGRMLSRAGAVGVACVLLAAQVASVSADALTSDLIPGPPDGSWQVYAEGTGAKTKDDIYGSKASTVSGFVDAYDKSWSNDPAQGLVDRLERFSSVFWASVRLSESRTAARDNKSHSSFKDVSGLGTAAYEVTDPADSQGYLADTIVMTQGDYVSVIALASKSQPDHATLMDQAQRQVAVIPIPKAEYNAVGQGIVSGLVWIAIGAGVLTIIVAAIVIMVVLRRRRPMPRPPAGSSAGPCRPPCAASPRRGSRWRRSAGRAESCPAWPRQGCRHPGPPLRWPRRQPPSPASRPRRSQ